MKLVRVLPLAVVLHLASAPLAHAYLDPGNGSMLLQLLLGGFAGLGVGIRVMWQRYRGRSAGNKANVPKGRGMPPKAPPERA